MSRLRLWAAAAAGPAAAAGFSALAALRRRRSLHPTGLATEAGSWFPTTTLAGRVSSCSGLAPPIPLCCASRAAPGCPSRCPP